MSGQYRTPNDRWRSAPGTFREGGESGRLQGASIGAVSRGAMSRREGHVAEARFNRCIGSSAPWDAEPRIGPLRLDNS